MNFIFRSIDSLLSQPQYLVSFQKETTRKSLGAYSTLVVSIAGPGLSPTFQRWTRKATLQMMLQISSHVIFVENFQNGCK